METQKNDEKNIVLELKHQLSRMMVQVDYMYRNDREMSRLDLDIMMENTRDLYNILVDYQANMVSAEAEKPEVFEKEINEGGELINRDVELEIETPESMKEPDINGENDGDVKGLSYQDEPVKDVDEEDADEEDWEDEDDEMFHVENINEDDFEDSPMLIPAEKPEDEDNSLAAKLQKTPISDIRTAIGINDKMMIINDLFGGSLERYSKSINALNEFPTLSGAKVYMSELQVEMQWDVKSQAYKLLNDLVERRFL